jgi:hypothetical protein
MFHGFAMKKVMLEVVRELNQSLIGQTAETVSSKDNRPHFQNTLNFLRIKQNLSFWIHLKADVILPIL